MPETEYLKPFEGWTFVSQPNLIILTFAMFKYKHALLW